MQAKEDMSYILLSKTEVTDYLWTPLTYPVHKCFQRNTSNVTLHYSLDCDFSLQRFYAVDLLLQ